MGETHTYSPGSFVNGNDTLLYRYLKPENSENQKLPLVIFLHGVGERGNDNQAQLTHGGDFFADNLSEFPALVIFPQCRLDSYWPNAIITQTESGSHFKFEPDILPGSSLHLVDLMIDSLILSGNVDPNRIYVGGISMGGMGTYALVAANPDLFAAAIVICGGGNTDQAGTYAQNTPFWIFHGEEDNVVSPDYAIAMNKALIDGGGNPKLTMYPKVGHNSWDKAFKEPDLLNWLFDHKKITPNNE